MKKQAHLCQNYLKNIIIPIFMLLCLAGIVSLQMSAIKDREKPIDKTAYLKEAKQKALRLDLLKKLPSFGFSNLITDWSFMDFVQYYGDAAARQQTGNSLSPDYFEVLVNKDPRFVTAYFYLSPATSLFAGQPEKSVSFTAKGLKSITYTMPLSYQLWIYKGTDELLFLGDNQAAQNSYNMAAKWAKLENTETSLISGARATETAQFIATNPDSKRARIGAWMMILANARDDRARLLALRRIQELGGRVLLTSDKVTVKIPEKD